jgi:hypothetical protein
MSDSALVPVLRLNNCGVGKVPADSVVQRALFPHDPIQPRVEVNRWSPVIVSVALERPANIQWNWPSGDVIERREVMR